MTLSAATAAAVARSLNADGGGGGGGGGFHMRMGGMRERLVEADPGIGGRGGGGGGGSHPHLLRGVGRDTFSSLAMETDGSSLSSGGCDDRSDGSTETRWARSVQQQFLY